MLHRYAATNFQSFFERVEVDLTVTQRPPDTNWIVTTATGQRVSKVMSLIGANGAGKTALLKPVAFLAWFITRSFQQPVEAAIPAYPHFAHQNEPTELECEADFDGHMWRYVLRCTQAKVLHEALYRKNKRWSYVFVRDWNEEKKSYSVRQQDFGLDQDKAESARANVSIIAHAAQYGVPLAMRWVTAHVSSNVTVLGRDDRGQQHIFAAAQQFAANETLRKEMERLLCNWDLGLAGVDIQEFESAPSNQPEVRQKTWIPYGRHLSRGQEYPLHFLLESSGTKSAFSLLSYLLPALSSGGLAVIDEFESDLHPHMLDAILSLFASPTTNPHNAQLLFSSHALEVLNILDKYQFMLVEKDENCESSAIRMDQIEGTRPDVSLYSKYMAGAFGAVPSL